MVSEIFASENWFLIAAAFIWIIVAVVQDFRKREVANWWNFSLIAVALAYRAFLSVFKANHWHFLWGVIGLVAGFVLANLFYYARIFAGGDAKLLLGLGAVLPMSLSWTANLRIFSYFLALFLVAGAAYGAIYSGVIALLNKQKFAKEFAEQFRGYRTAVFCVAAASIVLAILNYVFGVWVGVWLAVLLFAAPWMLLYAKAIEESCMVKKLDAKNLTIGDWLVETVSAGRKKIEPNWQGLSEDELKLIQQKCRKKVLIKYGLPFTPAFLLAFAALLIAVWYFKSIIF